jgi:hypothetical protein
MKYGALLDWTQTSSRYALNRGDYEKLGITKGH